MNFRWIHRFRAGLFIFLIGFVLSSCKKENRCDCIKRTGDIIKETRDLSGFTQLLIRDDVNVFLMQDSVYQVIVEAGENIAPLITTEVVDSTLVCRNRNRCKWTRSYKKPLNIYIHMPHVTQINAEGTGEIKGLNTINTQGIYIAANNSGNMELTIHANQLSTSMHGNVDLTLHGYSYHHDCDVQGTAYLLAGDLHTDYTYIHSATLGQCYVNVAGLLICKLDLKGDVFCYGNPHTVDYNYSNSGRLYLQ
jgi:hypothetical protein